MVASEMDSINEENNSGKEDEAIHILRTCEKNLEQAVKHYKVTPKQCNEMVQHIEEWYRKQPHLPEGELCKRLIVRHLITKSFSLERVKEKIDNYFSAKNKMPEFLKNRDPLSPNIEKCLKEGFWVVLPMRTPENYRVTMLRIKKPGNFSVVDLIKVAFMIGDYRMWNDSAVGDHWILDFNHIAFHQAMQMNPVAISKVAFYLNSCLAPKLKGLHIVNMPAYSETVLSLFKRTMKSKLLLRIHLYSNLEEITRQFPKEIVPKDFGGDEVSCDEITNSWLQTLQSPAWRRWFIDQDRACTDESKRIERSAIDEVFGVDGSFRKLDID